MKKVAIVGCAGVPAAYGGFETLAENLVLYRERHALPVELTVVCSGRGTQALAQFHGARLVHLPLSANGVSSIPYDAWSLAWALWRRADAVLVLGVSGAVALPLVRCLGRTRLVTNIDGIEWRRAKWKGLARHFLRFSEWLAVRCSHVVVADNAAVAEYVQQQYGVQCQVITYGGDHAVQAPDRALPMALPAKYALALCRIEPENNVELILEAFSRSPDLPLVFVGNWQASAFGRGLRARFGAFPHLTLADPEYDLGSLKTLRSGASLYVHGHSAGGTNPSLVEMMHFGVPILAYDCDFNRHTTRGAAAYFQDADSLADAIFTWPDLAASGMGQRMRELAQRHYTWDAVGGEYFRLLSH